MNDETIKLILDLGASGANVEVVKQKLEQLDTTMVKAGSSADQLKTKTVNVGQTMLQSGRFIQDFAQGGLGGVLNNVEGLTTALGGTAGLAGVVSGLGVAFFLAYPAVKSFFQTLIDGSNKVPESSDKLQSLNDALKKTQDELGKLKDKQTLTNTELARFNALTADEIRLTKESAEAKKTKEQMNQLDELRNPQEVEAERDRASDLQARLGGKQNEIPALARDAIQKEYTEAQKAWKDMQFNTRENPDRENDPAFKAVRDRWDKIFTIERDPAAGKKAVASAIIGGKESDVRMMSKLLPEGDFKRSFTDVLPENQKAWDDEMDSFNEGNANYVANKARRQAAQKKEHDRFAKGVDARAEVAKRIQHDTQQKDSAAWQGSKENAHHERAKEQAEAEALQQQNIGAKQAIAIAREIGETQRQLGAAMNRLANSGDTTIDNQSQLRQIVAQLGERVKRLDANAREVNRDLRTQKIGGRTQQNFGN